MVNKKIFMAGIFVLVGILVLAMVSAKHNVFHFWGDEVQEAPFDATVTVSNTAPIIVLVSGVNENQVTPNIVDPLAACGLAGGPSCPVATLSFVARDPNGQSTLNDASASVTFTSPGPRVIAPVTGACVPVACGSFCNPAIDQNFSCTVTMLYHYDPSPTAGPPDWGVTVSISDSAPTPLTATCGTSPSVACVPFDYTTVVSVLPKVNPSDPVPEVLWTGVNVGPTGDNQPANAPQILYNRGNIDIISATATNLDITAFNLLCQNVGCTPATDRILSERFSASGNNGGAPLAQCDVPATADAMGTSGVPVTDIPGMSIPYGASPSDRDDLYLCIYLPLDDLGLSDPVGYSTKAIGGTPWDVTF